MNKPWMRWILRFTSVAFYVGGLYLTILYLKHDQRGWLLAIAIMCQTAMPVIIAISTELHLTNMELSKSYTDKYYNNIILGLISKCYTDSVERANILVRMFNSLLDQGQFEQAEQVAQEVRSQCEKVYGAISTEVAGSLLNLANAQFRLKHYSSALATYARAEEILSSVPGENQMLLQEVIKQHSMVLSRLGRHSEALSLQNSFK